MEVRKENTAQSDEQVGTEYQEEQSVAELQTVPDLLEPPFVIIAEMEEREYGADNRVFYNITVNKNGTYSISERALEKNDGEDWRAQKNADNEGKWVVVPRVVGEDTQKVYDLRWENGNTHIYIPEDGEYIWDTNQASRRGSWEAVSNLNFKKGIKVVEYKTPNGTKVITPVEERIFTDPASLKGPDIEGKTYVSEDGSRKLQFENGKMKYNNSSYKYHYVGNSIVCTGLPRPTCNHTITPDGKTITDGNGVVYTLEE